MKNMNPNFLDGADQETQELFSKLLLNAAADEQMGKVPERTYNSVVPKPGFCIKTKNDKGEKVFVNVCHASNVPEPKDLTDEELIKVLESEDPTDFRIPMSLGEPHVEMDKGGKGCTAYDVIVNTKFLAKMEKSELFKTFFITISFEGLESKFQTTISKEWVILKNKKFMGTLTEQNVRKESKPFIMEMDGPSGPPATQGKKPLITEISSQKSTDSNSPAVKTSKAPTPKYTILQDPPEGHPEFLVAEIHLPKVKAASSFTLDIGEDRILLQTRADIYHMDIFLPYNLIQEECGAQFHRKSKILTITMPVQPLR
ncbi:PIH1 domain-containing protein 1-like [Liolophura sinensis]|uniref:PIH1 domain-containing protein 1-like n=1 Tax=Liolophura sinensis TaxID=3198878 RepID=UPI003158025F